MILFKSMQNVICNDKNMLPAWYVKYNDVVYETHPIAPMEV